MEQDLKTKNGSERAQEVLERLLCAHEAYYDVERDHVFRGRCFDGYAELHSSASRYVLVKRAKLWEANSHEYMFFVLEEHLGEPKLKELVGFMTSEALGKVVLERNHMCSYLTLVIIADTVDEDIERVVRKTRFRKSFMFGLKGWADLRLCVIDLSSQSVVTNAMGKELEGSLAALGMTRGRSG